MHEADFILSMDSSSEVLSLALARAQEGAPVWTHEEAGGAAASRRILPAIQELVQTAQCEWGDIACLSVGHGPGAFTGVRVACAVAQGLVAARALRFFVFSGLHSMAEAARYEYAPSAQSFLVQCVQDARMNQVYAAQYEWQSGAWAVETAPHLLDYGQLAALPARVMVGNIRIPFAQANCPLPVGDSPFYDMQPKADALLRLARQALARGEVPSADATHLQALYIRDKVALTTKEREAMRA